MMPIVLVIWSHFLVLELGVEVVQVYALYYCKLVYYGVIFLQLKDYSEDIFQSADIC